MGNFTFINTDVPGIIIAEPTAFGDERGFFLESWRRDEFVAAGISADFVQDNHSRSRKGVLRGIHFQRENVQAKLVRVVKGSVFDVGVDLRPNSPHFGKWVGVELNEENKRMLYVPEGFGHAFLVLSDTAEFLYKSGDYYNHAAEGGVLWDDADIGIKWPECDVPVALSEKDKILPRLHEQDFSFFEGLYAAK